MWRRNLVSLVVTAAVGLVFTSLAIAQFTRTASASLPLSSTTLAPPTALSPVQTNCKNSKPPEITVTWTATTSAFATGYTVERAPAAGGPFATVATLASGTTSTVDPDLTLAYTTTYFYRVSSTFHSWTGTSAVASVTTLNNKCA
jgi:hypothetical protein